MALMMAGMVKGGAVHLASSLPLLLKVRVLKLIEWGSCLRLLNSLTKPVNE